MGELERRASDGSGSLLPFFGRDRELAKAVRKVRRDTLVTRMQVRGVGRVTEQIMEDFVYLDDRRRELAGGSEFLNNALGQVELNYLRKAARIQSEMYKDL